MVAENSWMVSCANVWEPDSAQEAWRLLQSHGGMGTAISGGTLLRVQWEAGQIHIPKHLISLRKIPGVRELSLQGDELIIGAMVTLQECVKYPLMGSSFELLAHAAGQIAAPSVRQIATIGGNVMSGVGDTIPALLAADARLDFWREQTVKQIPLQTWLDQKRLQAGGTADDGLLLRIRVPRTEPAYETVDPARMIRFFDKVGRRESFTPSLVTVAFSAQLDPSGKLLNVRVAAGGGSSYAARLTQTESMLTTATVSASLPQALYESVLNEFSAIADPFASERYRVTTAAGCLAAGLWRQLKSG